MSNIQGSRQEECEAERANNTALLRASGKTFCPPYFHITTCFGPAPAGMTQSFPCDNLKKKVVIIWNDTLSPGSNPSRLQGSSYSRFCNENGRWANKTNYTQCLQKFQEIEAKPFQNHLQIIYISGYALSLTALILAMGIFIYFKKLSCLRNRLHCHFFLALSLRIIVFFAMQITFTYLPTQDLGIEVCFALNAVWHFSGLAKFAWMSAEGTYLVLVVLFPFRIEGLKLSYFCLGAWGSPGLLVVIWMIVARVQRDFKCPPKDEKSKWIIDAPILVLLFINLVIAIFIACTLYQKVQTTHVVDRRSQDFTNQQEVDDLRSSISGAKESRRSRIGRIPESHRIAMRSILILVPLLGMTYVVFIVPPHRSLQTTWNFITAFLNSTQGFVVALVLCFLNHEVQSAVVSAYRTWRDLRTLGRTGGRTVAMETLHAPLRSTSLNCA